LFAFHFNGLCPVFLAVLGRFRGFQETQFFGLALFQEKTLSIICQLRLLEERVGPEAKCCEDFMAPTPLLSTTYKETPKWEPSHTQSEMHRQTQAS